MSYTPNTHQEPNVITDRWMRDLSGSEYKIVATISRLTHGFLRNECFISQRKLRERTGLSNGALNESLAALVERGYLVRNPGTRTTASEYSLNLDRLGAEDLELRGTPENGVQVLQKMERGYSENWRPDLNILDLSLSNKETTGTPPEDGQIQTASQNEPYRTVDELTFESHVKGTAIQVFEDFMRSAGKTPTDQVRDGFLAQVQEHAQAYADTAAAGIKFLKRDARKIATEVLKTRVETKKLASELKRTERAEVAQLEAQAAAKAARGSRTYATPTRPPQRSTNPAHRPFTPSWEGTSNDDPSPAEAASILKGMGLGGVR